jgi:hypothetical protein
MARVVQRRSNPPYLVVTFVFLFLISTVLTFVFFSYYSDEKKAREKATTELNAFASLNERGNLREKMAAMKALEADKPTATFLGLYDSYVNELVTEITGDPSVPPTTAMNAAKKKLADLGANTGLLALVDKLDREMKAALTRQKELEKDNGDLNQQLQDRIKALQNAQDVFSKNANDLQSQLKDAQDQLAARAASYDANVASIGKDAEGKMGERDRQDEAKAAELTNAQKEVTRLKTRVSELQLELKKLQPKLERIHQPDGKVIRTVLADSIVYINIGSKDRVRVGLPFSVYDARTGVTADGEGKARIIVKNVFPETSECRLLQTKPGEPVVEGDLISNIAFDATIQPQFIVEGQFDLTGSGKADDRSAEIVKSMIAQYGGKVTDKVDVGVDYVVMGSEPASSPKPPAGAPAQQVAVWEQERKKVQQYNQIKSMAIDLGIPVLNTEQFLAFVGYYPER